MTLPDLVRELRDRGIRVRVKEDQLAVQAPSGALTAELRQKIAEHKAALIALLRDAESRPEVQAPSSLVGMAEPGRPTPSPAQRKFWYLQRIDPQSAIYNLPGIWRLKGPLDVEMFRGAIQTMVDRHDTLRSRFTMQDGHPIVTISDLRVEMPIQDFSHLPAEQREAAMGAFIEQTIEVPIDIEQGPPFRAILMRLSSEEHAILWMPHSIVWDGWSFDLLLEEFTAHYRAALEGRSSALPPPPIQFADFAAWQTRRLESGELDADLAYWRKQLAPPIASLDLPTDRRRSPGLGYEGARVRTRMDGRLLESVRELARAEGVTVYMVILAALDALLYRYTGVNDVLVASPLQGRAHPDVEKVIGTFVNTLFFRTRVEPQQTFRDLVHSVQNTCFEAVQHQDAPSDMVIEAMEENGLRRTPYEMIFIYQQATARVTEMGPVDVQSIGHNVHHVAVDLVMWAREHPEHIDFGFDYRTGLFDESRIRRLVGHINSVLASVVRNPTATVGALSVLTPEESAAIDAWSKGGSVTDRHLSVGGEIQCGGVVLDRQAVRAAADALTRQVTEARSATDRKRVALVLDGTAESAVALMALSRSNIDAQLLPTGLPASIVSDILERSGVGIVLSTDGNSFAPPTGAETLRVDLSARAAPSAKPDDAASGSVLLPVPSLEGGWTLVKRSWDAVRTDAVTLRDALHLRSGSGAAVFANGAADQFASGVLAVLGADAKLVLPDPTLPIDGWDLEDQVTGGTVQTVVAGSRALQQLIETGWSSRVERVFCCEPLISAEARASVSARADHVSSGWGMTETGVWALLAEQGDLADGAMGKPAPGVEVRVVDSNGQRVPVGIPGALEISGLAVADGYSERADHDRFVFGETGQRWFKTGERVRWDSKGRLFSDGHVFREAVADGRRIAFSHIETALLDQPGVHDAHAALQDVDGSRRVVAFVAAKPGAPLAPAELRVKIRDRIGAIGAPDAVLQLPELPRRTDGTVDEHKLAAQLKQAASARRHAEPRTEAERAVAKVWKEALNLPQVGLADNFFELGGHSLLAVQVTLKLEEQAGLRIDPRSLFFQTLEQVAKGADATAKTS